MFRFLCSKLSALFDQGAARTAASRIEIRFEPMPSRDGSDRTRGWSSISIHPANGDKITDADPPPRPAEQTP